MRAERSQHITTSRNKHPLDASNVYMDSYPSFLNLDQSKG
jgi:hypothetical protein